MHYNVDRAQVLTTYDLGVTQSETPEGYLYCQSVPIARIGTQQYLNSELEPDCEGGPDGVVHVSRHPDDVFHPNTVASFEGKPVTDDHPEEMLGPSTIRDYIVGTTLNVRRGEGGLIDYLVADLLIFDKDAIAAVRAGKRQVSCGYGSDYETITPGRARQHNIIGNHVALVARGRCGPSCAIGDEDMVTNAKKKSFMDKLMAFMDNEYPDGEAGKLTINDESPKGGGDIHLHVNAGPNGSTSIAPTTDEKADDKEDKDDKKDTTDAMKSFDERLKSMEDGFKSMKDSLDAFMAKSGTKDADKDDKEDKDDKKDTTDAKEDKGEGESEGEVDTKDADKEDDDDKDDKDTKDKKGTKDHATMDSAPLKAEFKSVLADAEILSPGLTLPTFDAAQPHKATMDSICLLRRRALAASAKEEEGGKVIQMLNGGKALDLKKLTCDTAAVFFNSAVSFARDRNNDTGKLGKARTTKDSGAGAPKSVADFNKATTEFYDRQKPKPANKSA